MNIIENKKKIAIIGRGTAGSLAVSLFNYYNLSKDYEIDWYFDPSINPLSVGEGSTVTFPFNIAPQLDMGYTEARKLDCTNKIGIKKIGWNGAGDYLHEFPLGQSGLHFNATSFQNCVLNKISSQVNIKKTNIIDPSNIDATHTISCTGKPKTYNEFSPAKYIPVNAAFVTQCYWEKPEFDYTLCVARPYGWVFGVPLQNRCSIGYIYNKDINSLEEVKEDIKEVFTQFNLTPSPDTNSLTFKNYYRKVNYTERVSYNGIASFFLEPLEATSTHMAIDVNESVFRYLFREDKPLLSNMNSRYLNQQTETERMIMLHYLAGSPYKTTFWDYAQSQGEKCILETSDDSFKKMISHSLLYLKENRTVWWGDHIHNHKEIGQWGISSYNQNLKGLNLYSKLNKLLNI